ncbi:MAG: hypothetical protein OXC46_08435 [Thaumarchaeota archaeon]|nr:hypothetical protein [Nitrososphaerota archaeon]
MCIGRKKIRFTKKSKAQIDQINEIAAKYKEKEQKITVRQMYYRLVSKKYLTHSKKSYKQVVTRLTDGRMTGLIDWDIIVDTARSSHMHHEFPSMKDFLDAAKKSYRRPRWDGQKNYVEVMVEKDALARILRPITDAYHVRLTINRGYTSTTFVHDLYNRLDDAAISRDKKFVLLYMGDHDPSGTSMPESIRMSLEELNPALFIREWGKMDVIALTDEQIKEYGLPSIPVNKKDTRAAKYMEKYGDAAWELDALEPEVLADILELNIKKYLNVRKYNKMKKAEEEDKKKMSNLLDTQL